MIKYKELELRAIQMELQKFDGDFVAINDEVINEDSVFLEESLEDLNEFDAAFEEYALVVLGDEPNNSFEQKDAIDKIMDDEDFIRQGILIF
mgnify:CR=1 FL=1|tara:strand:- start:2956 stop:3231 length:276 start_codon:yes stop_codon:yes gene_type:complete